MKAIKQFVFMAIITLVSFGLFACDFKGDSSTGFHTISFDTLGGEHMYCIVDIPHGILVDEPAEPIKEGYNFVGWSLVPVFVNDLPNFDEWFSFAQPVAHSKTIYPVWEEVGAFDFLEIRDGQAWITGSHSRARTQTLPSTYQGVAVVGICQFYNWRSLTTVIFPYSIRYVSESAFAISPHVINHSLKNIVLNEGLISIGDFAFAHTHIVGIDIPKSVQSIGAGAFMGTHIKELNISAPDIQIGSEAFRYCEHLVSVTIGAGILKIADSAFRDTPLLSSITLADDLLEIGDNAFRNSALTEVTLPSSIRRVGKYAFADISTLTQVKFEDGFGFIDDFAFWGANLSEIYLPASISFSTVNEVYNQRHAQSFNPFLNSGRITVTFAPEWRTLPRNMFRGVSNVVGINFNEGLVHIGDFAFGGDLYEGVRARVINLPSSLISVGSYAFGSAFELEEINLNDGLQSLGVGAFGPWLIIEKVEIPLSLNIADVGSAFSNVRELILPYGITEIPDYSRLSAFNPIIIPETVIHIGKYAFSGIQTINIPSNVQSIGYRAFAENQSLTELVLNEGLKSIGAYAFYNSPMAEVHIPLSVISIGENAFWERTLVLQPVWHIYNGFRYQHINGFIEIIGYVGYDTIIEVPGNIDGMTVRRIAPRAFQNTNIEKVTIFVPIVGERAFEGVSSLHTVDLIGVTRIESEAFRNTSLRAVNISDNVNYIGFGAFSNIKTLQIVNIEARITELTSIFHGASIEEIVLPSSIVTIGSGAFSRMSSLRRVVLNEGLVHIGSFAFEATSLVEVHLPQTVESIGDMAFANISTLTRVSLNEGLQAIGSRAFEGTSITEIVIPSTMREIGARTFSNIATLTKLTLNEGLMIIDFEAFKGTSITTLTIPSSVNSIFWEAFMDIAALTTLVFVEDENRDIDYWGYIWIGSRAFWNTNIKEVLIHSSIQYDVDSFPPHTVIVRPGD